ncbi:MAG: Fe-S cluster assembly ATPase SufC [Candidatus Aenigmatarchaeota archaeon]
MKEFLEIEDLHVSVDGKKILKGVNLKVELGEVHAIMGPNGSGKSTLAFTLMNHPNYKVEKGDIKLNSESILNLKTDERARKGIFLAFQYPIVIAGLNLFNFLWNAYKAVKPENERISFIEFSNYVKEKFSLVKFDETFIDRYLNEGFSGGEKKRCEIAQLAVLQPKFAILDETDSGLDIDALKIVANAINKLRAENIGIILITHYQRILQYVKPNFVHVMVDGRIVLSGGPELAEQLEQRGYSWIRENNNGN